MADIFYQSVKAYHSPTFFGFHFIINISMVEYMSHRWGPRRETRRLNHGPMDWTLIVGPELVRFTNDGEIEYSYL